VRRSTRTPAKRRCRLHRPARRRQVDAARRADQGSSARAADGRGAVDRPLLAVHQGALLGDRIRLSPSTSSTRACSSARWPTAARSAASRGGAAGRAADGRGRARGRVLETVGVGQAEVDIIDHADTIVLVLMPGSGDSIQALKAGVMEIPDVIVVNKADHPLTDRCVRARRPSAGSVEGAQKQEGPPMAGLPTSASALRRCCPRLS
jgi:putative protein kinase ArgK-like GTPase of G3E family